MKNGKEAGAAEAKQSSGTIAVDKVKETDIGMEITKKFRDFFFLRDGGVFVGFFFVFSNNFIILQFTYLEVHTNKVYKSVVK